MLYSLAVVPSNVTETEPVTGGEAELVRVVVNEPALEPPSVKSAVSLVTKLVVVV